MGTTAIMGMAACGGKKGDEFDFSTADIAGTYKITVWTSEVEGVSELTKTQIARFNDENKFGVKFTTTVEGVGEGEAATQMISSVEDGADLFFFAQDQTMRLMQAGALTKVGVKTAETVRSRNDESSIVASTVGESMYCYPATSDNGYFMFYDKSVVKAEHIDSLEDVLADCVAAGKNFSYELEGSGWYNAGFFFATGCHSDWTTNDDGTFTAVKDDFNSDKGVIALRGMQKVLKSSAYVNSSNTADFSAAIPSAVVISGTWGSKTAKEALGDNYAVADLPSFKVDGKSYHIGSFSGNKLIGVKPQVDKKRAAALQQLALYLTNDDCQLERFEQFGWGPSNIEAQKNEKVKSDPALVALAEQSNYAVPQGQIHGKWWDISKVYAAAAKQAAADDTAALKTILKTYQDSLDALFDGSIPQNTDWSVIGQVMGSNWDKDVPMTEKSGAWISVPVYFEAGNEFKVRKGGNWDDGNTGNVVDGATGYETLTGGNAKVNTAGLYIVKYVEDKGIELIPITLGVVGTINGWGDSGADVAMTKVDGEFAFVSAAIDFAAGAEVKIRFDGKWGDYGDIGADGGSGNFKVEAAGSKKVKVAWDAEKLAWIMSLVD